jgi:fucose permease
MWAIFGVFYFESAVIGQWIPRIPDIKDGLGLSDSGLGLALLSMPLGTLAGFSIAGRVIERTGLRNACRLFMPIWALLFIGPAVAQSFLQLIIALVISGMAVGMIETAMNTEAARIENALGKRLMSRCHGFWSLGTMAGALMGGVIAQSGIEVAPHFLMTLPAIAVGGYFAATALPIIASNIDTTKKVSTEITDTGAGESEQSGLFHWPQRPILLLCIMPLGVMMVEGAFIDWSAVFMRDVLGSGPLIIAVTYSFFSVIMAIVRLSGDALASHLGGELVVRVSGLAACAGIGLFSVAPNVTWAFFGAAVAGAGVAIVFPLAVTAAANRPGRSSADNVAALNMVAFTAFLIAPPLIGFLSDLVGLRVALLSLAPLAFLTFLLASEVASKPK